ncbi:UNVERIFIED_CONTAM: hypothetical protein K2H54_002084 [Gekko kuhli]
MESGTAEGGREPGGEGEWCELPSVKILGILFSLRETEWRENWRRWQRRVTGYLEKWTHWKLSTGQKVWFFMAYCIPAGNYLATVYPPPEATIAAVTRDVFRWLFGTVTFPLARVVPQRKQREGGLGLVDIGLWFLVLFLHFNLGHWRDAAAKDRRRVGTGEVSEPWILFGDSCMSTRWGELWWNGGTPIRRLTASLKRELPDFMREAAATIRRRAEMQTKHPTPPEETRNTVIAYLNKIRQWEKEHSKEEAATGEAGAEAGTTAAARQAWEAMMSLTGFHHIGRLLEVGRSQGRPDWELTLRVWGYLVARINEYVGVAPAPLPPDVQLWERLTVLRTPFQAARVDRRRGSATSTLAGTHEDVYDGLQREEGQERATVMALHAVEAWRRERDGPQPNLRWPERTTALHCVGS